MRYLRPEPRLVSCVTLLLAAGCDLDQPPHDVIQQPGDFRGCTDVPEEPELLLEEVWATLDATYPFFDYKQVDWQALHDECRDLVCEERNDYDDFVGAGADCLLAPLADANVAITDVDGDVHTYGLDPATPNALQSLADARLDAGSLSEGKVSVTGTLNGGRFGYFRLTTFDAGPDDFASRLGEVGIVEGWVLDLRSVSGGVDAAAAELAGLFVDDTTTPYAYTQVREETDGDPLTHELAPPTARTLAPNDVADDVFVGPVAVLTGKACSEVCENFVARMKLATELRTFGATTYGAAGNPDESTLATDGVTQLRSSTWLETLGDGTTVIEWNGIPADEPVSFTGGDEDQVLEAAVLWLAGA
jgi:hypothetical protein